MKLDQEEINLALIEFGKMEGKALDLGSLYLKLSEVHDFVPLSPYKFFKLVNEVMVDID